jgi:hypothetical protein
VPVEPPPPPPPPPHDARNASAAVSVATRNIPLIRDAVEPASIHAASIAKIPSSDSRSDASRIIPIPATPPPATPPLAPPAPGPASAATLCVTAAVRAVVVTVSVVPLIVQLPSGMLHVALSVGAALNPAVLIANVKLLPAPPVCDGCDGVTEAAPANVAVTITFPEIANVQVVVVLPAHSPPLHAVNVSPLVGTAVNVIDVPEANDVPLGVCVIVPGPLTLVVSV